MAVREFATGRPTVSVEAVHRQLQVAVAVILGSRQPPTAQVDLQSREDAVRQ